MSPEKIKELMRSAGINCEEKTFQSLTHPPLACHFSIGAAELCRLVDLIEVEAQAELRRSIGGLVMLADEAEKAHDKCYRQYQQLGTKMLSMWFPDKDGK